MKKYIFSFVVACLSLASSLMTFQAAAQENLTESQVRSIVEGALESNAKKAGKSNFVSSLYGPRFEIVQAPEMKFTLFKLDKETGETWVIDTSGKNTSSKKLSRQLGGEDEVRPGEVNYQLIADSWYRVFLLNVHTGTFWEAEYKSGKKAHWEDFKVVETGD